MKLSDGIAKAYENKWSFNNTFTVAFSFTEELNRFMKSYSTDAMNLNIISIQTPEFSNSPVELWIGNRWRTQNGRDNLYKFSITFRDMDQMSLYRAWHQVYLETAQQYFDHVSFNVKLYKDADWYNEGKDLLMNLEQTIVESVSQLTFSNDTQNQLAEFTVGFKCTAPQVIFPESRNKANFSSSSVFNVLAGRTGKFAEGMTETIMGN